MKPDRGAPWGLQRNGRREVVMVRFDRVRVARLEQRLEGGRNVGGRDKQIDGAYRTNGAIRPVASTPGKRTYGGDPPNICQLENGARGVEVALAHLILT